MEEMKHTPNKPESEKNTPPVPPFPNHPTVSFPAGNRELNFGTVLVITSILLADFVLLGGFHAGFALASSACILCSVGYFLRSGKKVTTYTGSLLILSLILTASFLRSNDGFVKFVTVCFLLLTVNLALCQLSGQNLRSPEGITSLLDAPRALFMLGIGKLEEVFRGTKAAMQQMSAAGKKRNAILVGLLVSVPVLAILIPLLMSADAAFEGLLNQLPPIDWEEIFGSVFLGAGLACLLYSRGVALIHTPKREYTPKQRKGISPITLNTVLSAVSVLYVVYLISQLAYFVGGFAGILPEGYTMAQYARRGFFEMAWLSGINLTVMTLAVGLVEKKDGRAPLSTRLLCLFIGLVTLFFVVTASAKMLLYIDAYGLTRLRVLTEVIMIFLAVTTVIVSIWLFVPKMPYMKAVLLTALVMGAVVAWIDVDTVVAKYNVEAYQSGKLETVDVYYLGGLSYGAAPYIQDLTESPDPGVADSAKKILRDWAISLQYYEDLRSWNIAAAIAWDICEEYT